MRGTKDSHYYSATGFSPYYFAHVVYNVVGHSGAFLRRINDLLGDAATENLCRPFPRFSNLHAFIEDVLLELFFENPGTGGTYTIHDFILHTGLERLIEGVDKDDIEALSQARDAPEYDDALMNLINEVFHILFRDLAFLQRFNDLTAGFIRDWADGSEDSEVYLRGRQRRITAPQYVKDAIYHRDQGECRACRKAVDRIVSPAVRERYDHIVALANGGANDISNIQLLCEACNSAKSDGSELVSPLYHRAFPTR